MSCWMSHDAVELQGGARERVSIGRAGERTGEMDRDIRWIWWGAGGRISSLMWLTGMFVVPTAL